MNETTKTKITKDLSTAFQSTDYKQGLTELGLFFKSDTDRGKIQESLNYNDSLRKFILDNKVKTAGQ